MDNKEDYVKLNVDAGFNIDAGVGSIVQLFVTIEGSSLQRVAVAFPLFQMHRLQRHKR
jgi:hypothetical protein